MKIESFIIALIVVLLFFTVTGSSIFRIISSTNDNIYTFIRNSNNNYWEATSDNIQVAIDDLNNLSGTVWLPGNKTFYLSNTVVVHRNITLDMVGSEFRLPQGINITVVELKSGSGIKNGVIDVSGYSYRGGTWSWFQTSNTSFATPNACIYLNASSYIEYALIENMILVSIPKGFVNSSVISDNSWTGRGYGIYMYATNTTVPQRISNVHVKFVGCRLFYIGIYINNERHPLSGEEGAYIERNFFTHLTLYANSWMINITRDTSVSKEVCSASNNVFNMVMMQTGTNDVWGSNITWGGIHFEGEGNVVDTAYLWDFSNGDLRKGPGTGLGMNLTTDSEHCFVHTTLSDGWWNHGGTNNIVITSGGWGGNNYFFRIGKVYELG